MSYDPATTVPQYWSYDTNGSEVNNEVVNVINAYILAQTNQTNQTKIPAVLPRVWNVIMFAGEVLVLAESVSLKVIRNISHTLSLAESVSRFAKATRSITTETLMLAEGFGFTSGFSSGFEQIPGLVLKIIRRLSEHVSITELRLFAGRPPGIRLKVTRKISPDALLLVESIARIKRLVRTISDTLYLSDGGGFSTGFEGFLTGLSTGFEQVLGGVTIKVTRSIKLEFLGLTEGLGSYTSAFTTAYEQTGAVILKVIRNIAPPEVLSLVETSITSLFIKGVPPGVVLKVIRPRIEVLHLTESVARKAARKVAADTLTLAETAISGIRRVPRTVSETLTLSETSPIRRKIARLVAPAEALHLIEFLNVIKNPTGILHSRFVTDTIQFAEAAIKVKTSRLAITEILHLAESAARTMHVTISEALTIAEGFGFTSGFTSGFERIPGLVLKVTRNLAPEVLHLAETITKLGNYFRTITESLNLAESVSKFAGKVVSETLQLTEIAATATRKVPRIISESLGLAEAAVGLKAIRKMVDQLSLSESLTVALNGVVIYVSALIKEDVYRVIALFNKNIRRLRDLFFGQPGNTG